MLKNDFLIAIRNILRQKGYSIINILGLAVGLASVILIIACINFMNLATARSAKRSKEIGLRKVMGANLLHCSIKNSSPFRLPRSF